MSVMIIVMLWLGAGATFALGFVVGAALGRRGAWDEGYAHGLSDSRGTIRLPEPRRLRGL